VAAKATAAPVDTSTALVEKMVRDVETDATLARVNAEEKQVAQIDAAVLAPWRKAFAARDAAAFQSLLASPEVSPAWASSAREKSRERDGIRESSWKLGGKGAGEAARYLSEFSMVDAFSLEARRFDPAATGGTLELAYDLRGRTAAGARRNDRGTLRVDVTAVEGGFKIAKIAPGSLEILEAAASRKPVFEEATKVAGLEKIPVVDRREAIRRGGYAVAVSDYDADGKPDLLVGHWGPLQLLRNDGTKFVDVTAAAGLQGETLVKSAAFGDLDNDGLKDLVLLRFVENADDGVGDFVAYRNLGNGKFEKKSNVLPRSRPYDRGMPLALADFDGNGTLDLYLGFPGGRDFTNGLDRKERTDGLNTQGLWFNDGKWGFTEATKEASALLTDKNVYPHATLVADFNTDGKQDLLIVDDSGRMSPVYKNDGTGRFANATAETGVGQPGWSMGAAAGDFDSDGNVDIVTTNVEFVAVHRMAAAGARETNPKLKEKLDLISQRGRGMLLYRNKGDGTFEEVAQRAGVAWPGEGAGGVEFIDYNNDGHLDLYVENGLWSGGSEDFSSLFLRSALLSEKSDNYESMDEITGGSVYKPRTSANPNPVLGVLREFKGTLANPKAVASAKPTLGIGGEQRNRLFRNNGNGTFTEVGYLENADRAEDGYVIAVADIDADGRQDLFLRHCDPAPGRSFETVTLLRNTSETGKSLNVYLQGKRSNRDGFGAKVTAWIGDRRIVREVRAVSGATQGEPSAFVGLGNAEKADRIEVRWPSGQVQTFKNVPAGRVSLREGDELVRLAAR
jgi:hypothetical protein